MHEENLATTRELEFIRYGRDLLRREFELVRREAELRGHTSVTSGRSTVMSESGTNNAKELKDLLSEFDGASNTF